MTYKSTGLLHTPFFHLKQPLWLCAAVLLGSLISPLTASAADEPWSIWQRFDPDSNTSIDHGGWQQFLEEYVSRGADGINRVAYDRARQSEWPGLRQYLQNLAAIDPRTLNQDEAMAYWINLYNALTVDVVLRQPGKTSIRKMGIGLFSFGPWDDEVFTVAGTGVTLNDIEHRILRPIWQDHRIHYAVNCASIGCPDLSRTAYTGAALESQLQAAETAYLSHPRAVSFDAKGRLLLSSIFDWYQEDFGADEQGLLIYLAEHHSEAERLRSYRGRIRYDYDWQLNAAP